MSDSEYSESVEVEVENNTQDNGNGNEVIGRPILPTPTDCSSSSELSTSITSSSESDQDDDNDDSFELAKITKQTLTLPKGLCESSSIFREFFSLDTWHALPIPVQNHLQQFLPRFAHLLPPQLDAIEQTRTLSMLFNGRLERFGRTPLCTLQQGLERGNYRPDILKLRQSIAKSKRREQRFRQCEHISQIAKQLFLSRQRLVDVAYQSTPDTIIKVEQCTQPQPKPTQLYADNKLSAIRARKRFYKEISQMVEKLGFKTEELSADEDELDKLTVEELQDDAIGRVSAEELTEPLKATGNISDRCIYSTLFKRQKDVDDEEACRQQQKSKQLRLCNKNFRYYLREHKRRKLTEPTLPEFETCDIRLKDIFARAQLGSNFKHIFNCAKTFGRKSKTQTNCNAIDFQDRTTDIMSTSSTLTPVNNSHINTSNNNCITTPFIGGVKLREPPALVPIQPLKKVDVFRNVTALKTSAITSQQELLLDHMPLTNNSGNNVTSATHINNNLTDLLTENQVHFNLLDNEVELQQEEVETFTGNIAEETIPTFVLSNDVTTPIKHQKCYNANQMMTASNNLSASLPKLEPILVSSSLSNHTTQKSLVSPSSTSGSISCSGHNNSSSNNHNNINNSNTNNSNNSELIQETHSSYFSLIRDFFCYTPNYRMRYDELKSKVDTWLRNPITALNEWYSLANNWSLLLKSAINFLIGDFQDLPEEYVPYIEYKSQINIYQWIGAGRDSDNRLTSLCQIWMEKRRQQQCEQTSTTFNQQSLIKWDNLALMTKSPLENDDSSSTTTFDCSLNENTMGNINIGITPLPPRYPTTWKVKPASPSEIIEFQRQERERFEKPHKAYTYRMHGYESVVGPVKGIYTAMLAMTKARGHSMMVGDRPNFVTILTLVRDATARLPNGEGTRADISELLKCSQYINPDAAENILQTIVSGALDRMHAEHDPCVKYDAKRKIWIYLHRNRSEEEFERLHQQNQGLGKVKKLLPRKSKTPCNSKAESTVAVGEILEISTAKKENATTNPAQSTTDYNNGLSVAVTLPALVPSTPLIANNIVMQNQQQQQQKTQKQTQQAQLLMNNKCLPVPPLKYNIPSHTISSSLSTSGMKHHQQQQKSLLKTIIRQDNQINSNYINNSNIRNANSDPNASSIVQNTSQMNRPFNFPISSSSNKLAINNINNYNNAKNNATTTPIIVATPQGLQTIHVANTNRQSTTTTVPIASGVVTTTTNIAATTTTNAVTFVATSLSGKRMTASLNKPIIISQLPQQQQQQLQLQRQQYSTPTVDSPSNCKTNANAINQQSQQIINIASGVSGVGNITLPLSMSSNANVSAATTMILQTTTPQSKNVLRLVPTSTVLASSTIATPLPSDQGVLNTQRVLTAANLITTSSALPSLILSHSNNNNNNNNRVITATTSPNLEGKQKQQQQQQPSNLQIVKSNKNSNSNVITPGNTACTAEIGSGSTVDNVTTTATTSVVKMSAQAFANLQHKQQLQIQQQQQSQQRLSLKGINTQNLAVTATKAPQRIILGNTTVLATPLSQTSQKNIILQQVPIVVARSTTTSTTANITAATATSTTAMTINRIQTINSSNLTSQQQQQQQQRVLIQKIKQQQQQQQTITTTTTSLTAATETASQTQYKTVQIVSANNYQRQQQSQKQIGKLLTLPQDNLAASTQPQSITNNVARFIKTTVQQQQRQSDTATTTSATRMVTNSGQIITLENFLQKKGNTLRIASGSTAAKAMKVISTNIKGIQQSPQQQRHQSNVATATPQTTSQQGQFAVMSLAQPITNNNIINIGGTSLTLAQRVITTQANDNCSNSNSNKLSTSSSTPSNTVSQSSNINSSTSTAIGRAFASTPNNKDVTTTTATPVSASIETNLGGSGDNIRIINAARQTSNLNLSNCLQGKQIIFAPNSTTIHKQLATTALKNQTTNSIVLQQQQHQPSQQLRVQSHTSQPNSVIIGGHTIRLQQPNIINKAISAGTSTSSLTTTAVTMTTGTTTINTPVSLTTHTTNAGPSIQTLFIGNQMLRVHQMPQKQTAATTSTVTATKTTTMSTTAAITTTPTSVTTNLHNSNLEISSKKTDNTSGSTTKTIFLGTAGQTLRLQQTNLSVNPKAVNTINKNIIIQRNNQQNNSIVGCKINNNVNAITTGTTTIATNASTTGLSNRVVFAVQGGGQILLSPAFQGSNINLKNLHNVKLISLANPSSQIKHITTTITTAATTAPVAVATAATTTTSTS